MKSWTKRGLAILLAAMMLITVVPTALAAEEEAVQPLSLLPLETRSIHVDLTGLLPAELEQVKVSDLLADEIANGNLTGTEKVAWARSSNDSYQIVDMTDNINLRDLVSYYGGSIELSMIVGSGKQLDGENIRYTVQIRTSDFRQWLVPTIYKQDSRGARTEVPILDHSYYNNTSGAGDYDISVRKKDAAAENEHYVLSFAPSAEYAEAFSRYTVKVLKGNYLQGGQVKDITDQIWDQDLTQAGTGYVTDFNEGWYSTNHYTIELWDGESLFCSETFYIAVGLRSAGLSRYTLRMNQSGTYTYVEYSSKYEQKTVNNMDCRAYTISLYKEYPANGTYSQRLDFRNDEGDWIYSYDEDFSKLLAVTGSYKTRAEAEAAIEAGEVTDITDTLFSSSYGYEADYSGGVMFSVFFGEDPYYISIQTVTSTVSQNYVDDDDDDDVVVLPQRPGSSDTYFRVNGAEGVSYWDLYVMPYEHDAYYANGYQTVFLLDSEADLSKLKPSFYNQDVTHIYAGDPAVLQTSRESEQDFSQGPVAYSAASENGENQRNYFVTFAKKQTGGPSLFVNGANGPKEADGSTRRELFLDDYYGEGHDIFLTNLGDEEMTNLTVTLADAKNVKLDEYWTVGGENNDTLAPFTTAGDNTYRDNIAKIRLVPDGEGEISGKLSITYGVGQDTVVFTLTGNAGNPTITTTAIPEAVKYVPYAAMIQNSNMYDWNKVSYELSSGKLPKGVELLPNGEIYGVPQETGDFPIQIRMINSVNAFPSSTARFTLKVKENTDANVEAETDEGYELTTRLPASVKRGSRYTIVSDGDLPEFIDLWLDGKRLKDGVDYEKSKGSTIINANSQVFQNAGSGNHTLAFEFRVNGDANQDLKKAAQNFKVASSGGSGSSGSHSSSGGGHSGGLTTPGASTSTASTVSFQDVTPGAWFYDSAMWAARNNLMIGVDKGVFAPNDLISQTMVATIMARVAKVNLSGDSSDVANTGVEPGQWYTTAAVWAWRAGIVGDATYAPLPPLTRGDLAVMLVRYLDYLGVNYTAPDVAAVFADNSEMTAEQLAAFQRLYNIGILEGVGGNYMAPQRSTTRAEMAIITQRLSTYLANK